MEAKIMERGEKRGMIRIKFGKNEELKMHYNKYNASQFAKWINDTKKNVFNYIESIEETKKCLMFYLTIDDIRRASDYLRAIYMVFEIELYERKAKFKIEM